MGRIWVLDTETKGTGAQMVPLEDVQTGIAARPELARVPNATPRPRPAAAPRPHEPSVFKVVDALSRQTLAEGAGARETVELLGGVRSVVDVSVYVWEPAVERWRVLTLAERQMLWRLRERQSGSS